MAHGSWQASDYAFACPAFMFNVFGGPFDSFLDQGRNQYLFHLGVGVVRPLGVGT